VRPAEFALGALVEWTRRALEEQSEARIPKALAKANKATLAMRPCLNPEYSFTPVSMHDGEFHSIRREFPYFSYVGVEVEGVGGSERLPTPDTHRCSGRSPAFGIPG